jgi:DNA-directed RNA polymerase specialized sigma24 family protein
VNAHEFSLTVERHHHALVRFAYYLGGTPDAVSETVARLQEAKVFEKYQHEPEATRIPAWLRRAVEFTVRGAREREQRRERLLRVAVAEGLAVDNLQMPSQGGVSNAEADGFGDEAQLDVGLTLHGVQVLEREHEHRAYLDALSAALQAELESGRVEPAVVTGLRLVVAGGKTWKEAGAEAGMSSEGLRKRVTRALPVLRGRVLEAIRSDDVAHVVVKGAQAAPEAR